MGKEKISQKKAWYIVLISSLMGCSISAAFPQFSMTIANVSAQTGLSESFLLTSDTVKSAAIVLGMLCSGFMYKKLNTKVNFILALICTSLPQFVLPFISSPVLFMFFKVMQGFASFIFPVFLLIIMDVIAEKQAGLATAVFNGVFYSGGGVGGTIAGYFIAKSGWLSSFFAIGVIEIVIGLIWLFTVKDTTDKNAAAEEERLDDKSSSLELLKMPVVWLLILAFVSTTFVIQAITVDFPLFSSWLGYSELESGKINTAVTFGLLAACLVSGKISDMLALRMNNKGRARIIALAVGPVLIIAASLMLIVLDLSSFSLFYATAFIFSFGGSWGLGTFYSILPEIFDEERLPIITGLAGGAGDAGMPLAPLLVGVVFGAKGMWHFGWSVCIVIAALSLLACFLLLGNKKIRNADNA